MRVAFLFCEFRKRQVESLAFLGELCYTIKEYRMRIRTCRSDGLYTDVVFVLTSDIREIERGTYGAARTDGYAIVL